MAEDNNCDSERRNMPKQKKNLTYDEMRRKIESPDAVIHFIGIGGVSMYTLSRLALDAGYNVTGSDRVIGYRTRDLVLRGVTVHIGHSASNVQGATLAVYSHAVSADNPELTGAKDMGIPTVSRAEFMGAVMLEYKSRIGVCGTHGKSTTVAMLDAIFSSALREPTTLSGADLQIGEPIRIGNSELLLYEACEYRDSFLHFSPTVAVALNLELDHTDYFPDIKALRASFRKALSRATDFCVVNYDDGQLCELIPSIKGRVVTFGQSERADYRYLITAFRDTGMEITLYHHGTRVRKFKLSIPGVHNASNAAAAITVALEYGLDADTVAGAIESFRGIHRRLEYVGDRFGRAVYYDYAHHPTEIAASINALKLLTHDMVTVVFKPHTYTRTASLWSDFSSSLSLADHIILTDIYPAREEPIEGISSQALALDIGDRAIYSSDSEVCDNVDAYTRGVIVVMGAGELEHIKDELIAK